MAQLKWWMARIGVLIVGGTGAAWAAEEAAGAAAYRHPADDNPPRSH